MCYRIGGVNFWLLLLATTTYSLVPPRIRRVTVTSDIRYRFATTHITFDVGNTQSNTQDFYLEAQLPAGSLVSNISLYVNETLYESKSQEISEAYKNWLQKTNIKLKPIKEDRSLYFESNMFVMTVSMAGLSKGQFNFTYNYLLHRQNKKYKFPVYIFFRQGQFVEDIEIKTFLWEPRKITDLSVSLFKERNMPIISDGQKVKFDPEIRRIFPNKVYISYRTSLGNVRNIFTRNFLLEYSLIQGSNTAGDVLWHHNEGLYFFAPLWRDPLPKDIVFTIDYTDSMEGEKLSEVQSALSTMLRMTSHEDRFNIILYNSKVFRWQDNLQPVNAENIQKALHFLKTIPTTSVSDFNLAIKETLSQLSKPPASNNNRPRVVYFFTDGWHSVEYIKRHKISKSFREANKHCHAIFFTVALHAKADYIVMKTLSNLSGGKMLRIIERQNISESMVNFYKEMNTPLLTNISVVGPYRNTYNYVGVKNYYKGSENILYINESNINPVDDGFTFTISALGAKGNLSFEDTIGNSHIEDNDGGLNSLQRRNFLTHYLDFLFIRIVIDRKLKKRRKEAINRAEKNGFLTPWTYLSAIPKSSNYIENLAENISEEEIETAGRGFTGSGVGDPHFTIGIPGMKRPVCFDLSGHDGDVINLLADDTENLFVNAKIIKASNISKKTYLGEISIVKPNKIWIITPKEVEQKTSEQSQWKDVDKMNKTNGISRVNGIDQINQTTNNRSIDDISITYSGYRTLTVTTNSKKGRIEFLLRRTATKHQPIKIEYLNFYLTDSSGLSRSTYGLIGQFINWKGNITKLHMQPKGTIQSWIKLENQGENRTFKAVLTHSRRSMFAHQECWTVWKEGKGFIKGKYEDYLTHGLNSTSSSQR